MATAHKRRSKNNRSRKFKRPARGVVHDATFAIDYSKLPADLSKEALEELEAELPKSKKKAKTVEHAELFNLNLSEMIELAESEKIDVEGLRTRNEIYRALTSARLRARTLSEDGFSQRQRSCLSVASIHIAQPKGGGMSNK